MTGHRRCRRVVSGSARHVDALVIGAASVAVGVAGEPRPVAVVVAIAGLVTAVYSFTNRQKGTP